MAKPYAGPGMTIDNMRALHVPSLDVTCQCGREVIVDASAFACPDWHFDGDRGFAYARFPLRSCLTGMRLPNEPISIETLLLRVALALVQMRALVLYRIDFSGS